MLRRLAGVVSIVSLDILPADIPAAFAPEMAAACTEALSEGSCALASTLPESAQPEAVALVLWKDGSYREVTVRVGRGNGQWVVRSLTFADADSVQERWVAVGLTVATLVGESQSAWLRLVPPPPRPSAPPKQEANAPAPRRSAQFDAAVGVLAGPGWSGGGPQYGVWLNVGTQLSTRPFSFHAFGSYAQSVGPETNGIDPRTHWLTAGLSAEVLGTIRSLNVQASGGIELAFRRVQTKAHSQRASDDEIPIRARVFASYPGDGRFAFCAGTLLRIPPVGSAESDANHLRGPSVALELLAGLKVQL
jgi:hypothetical protein